MSEPIELISPKKHIFLKDSDETLHEPNENCWCGPELWMDQDDELGEDWVWFHRVLN